MQALASGRHLCSKRCWMESNLPWIQSQVWVPGHCGGASGKEPISQCRRHKRPGFDPWLSKIPGGGHGNPLQCSSLENPHRQRSLVGYSPWACKESDTTEVTWHTGMHYVNGSGRLNPRLERDSWEDLRLAPSTETTSWSSLLPPALFPFPEWGRKKREEYLGGTLLITLVFLVVAVVQSLSCVWLCDILSIPDGTCGDKCACYSLWSTFEIWASHSSLPYNLSPLWCLLTPLLLFSQSLWSLLDYELAESRETIDQQTIAEWINTSHFLGSPRACWAEEWWRPSWIWGGSQILHGPSFPAAAYIGFLWLPWQITINPVT